MRGWGGGGGGWVVWLGGRDKTDTHRKNEQTTKKWVVDGARLDRWWGKTGGKENQKTQSVVVNSLLSTSAWNYLTSTPVHCARVVGGMQRPHDKGERAVGFMVSTTTGTGGGGKGAEEQVSLALLALAGGRAPQRACCLCPGMVLRDVCGIPTRTLSPSVQLTHTSTEQQRQHREQTVVHTKTFVGPPSTTLPPLRMLGYGKDMT
jgi:hypothetical protein